MKLSKLFDDHVVAHLFEHLFYIELDTVLRDAGFFPIIDFDVEAFTEKSRVTFDISSYTDMDMITLIQKAGQSFLTNESLLDIAISQIENEYARKLICHDRHNLVAFLKKMNNTPSNSLGSLRTNKNLLRKGRAITPSRLTATLSYPGDIDAALKPLFRLVAGTTLNVFVSDIADTHGGFVDSRAFETDLQKNLVGEILLQNHLDLKEMKSMFRDSLCQLDALGGYDRLLKMLKDINQITNPPLPDKTLEDTGVSMDAAKWRDVSTRDNLDKILDAMQVEISQT